MQNKARARSDVQWIISSLSLAITVGLWGVLASGAKRVAAVIGQANLPPAAPTDQVVLNQSQMLLPGQKLLFGGTAPQPSQPVITTRPRHQGGGGGGGGGSPAASTGSSHP